MDRKLYTCLNHSQKMYMKKLDSDINPQQFSDMVFIHEINFAERYSIDEETFNRDTTNTTF